MLEIKYDFSTWTSLPSSLRLTNDEDRSHVRFLTKNIPAIPNSLLRLTVDAKKKDVTLSSERDSMIAVYAIKGEERPIWLDAVEIGGGTSDWKTYSEWRSGREIRVPSDITQLGVAYRAGARGQKVAITWLDNLELYQNEKHIYKDRFNKWSPLIGAVVGGTIGFIVPETGVWLSSAERGLLLATTGVGSILGGITGYLLPELPKAPVVGDICPVCGTKLPKAPLGVDVKCPKCGFVSAWTRG